MDDVVLLLKFRAWASWRRKKRCWLCWTDEDCHVLFSRWVSMIVVVLEVGNETRCSMKFDLSAWSAKWLGFVQVINIEVAIGLAQLVSFAAMLSPYFESFEGSDCRQQIEYICQSSVGMWLGCQLLCCSSLGLYEIYTYCIYRLHI